MKILLGRIGFRFLTLIFHYKMRKFGNSEFWGNHTFLELSAEAIRIMKEHDRHDTGAFWEIIESGFVIFDAKNSQVWNLTLKYFGITSRSLSWGAHGLILSILYIGYVKRIKDNLLTAKEVNAEAIDLTLKWLQGSNFPERFIKEWTICWAAKK